MELGCWGFVGSGFAFFFFFFQRYFEGFLKGFRSFFEGIRHSVGLKKMLDGSASFSGFVRFLEGSLGFYLGRGLGAVGSLGYGSFQVAFERRGPGFVI